MSLGVLLFFFFSSRRRHTRSLRDWSSDVCSSDLTGIAFRSTPQTADPRPRPRSLRPESQCRSPHALCSQAAARAPSSRSDARLGPVRSHRFAYEKVARAFRHSAHYSSKVGLQQAGFDGRLGLLIHSNIFVEPNETQDQRPRELEVMFEHSES